MKVKIIFVARALDSSRVIADMLLREKLVDQVVFETGKIAKQKKMLRMLRRKPFWRLFLLPLDLFFLVYMSFRANQLFYQKYSTIPAVPVDLWIDDVNEEKCLQFLKAQQPDILLIYGTAILKKPVLSVAKNCVLNIHGAIVPKYRNVHGEFWAVAHQKYEELGTSILVTDQGIDSGDIVGQRTLGQSAPVTVSEAKLMVFEDTLKLIHEVVTAAKSGRIPRRPQAKSNIVFQTPGFLDWLKFRVKL